MHCWKSAAFIPAAVARRTDVPGDAPGHFGEAEVQAGATVFKSSRNGDPAKPAKSHRQHSPENLFVFYDDRPS